MALGIFHFVVLLFFEALLWFYVPRRSIFLLAGLCWISIRALTCLLRSQKLDVLWKLEVPSLKFTPGIGQITFGQIPQKQKRGWIIFFFKNCLLSFSKHSQMTAFVKLIPKRYTTWGLCTLYVPCTRCARCITRARSVHKYNRCSDPMLYTSSESAWLKSFGSASKKIRDNFWKKNIFSSKGPPLGFGVFVWQCFGRSWGLFLS